MSPLTALLARGGDAPWGKVVRRARRALLEARLLARYSVDRRPKVVYLLTPPPRLRNIGDHAQAVAIRRWMDRHYPGRPVVELDKDQTRRSLPVLRRVVRPADLVFLHSGGNLGDRGLWSETTRRQSIASLPRNAVVSLPQTIYFSDTDTGRRERATTVEVYGRHQHLMVIGRDPVSGQLAEEMFPGATTMAMPDFVLSLPTRPQKRRDPGPASVLLCLRQDDESALTREQQEALAGLPHRVTTYDTTIEDDIPVPARDQVLEDALRLFEQADAVVTDRYHGLIFSVITRTPAVVLRTVDHKLTSALHWFDEIPWVTFASSVDEVPELLARALEQEAERAPDYGALYFDRLPAAIDAAFHRS